MSGQTAGHDGAGASNRIRIVVVTVLVATVGAAAALAATAGPTDQDDGGPSAEVARLVELATVRTETSAPRREAPSEPTPGPAPAAPVPPPDVAGPAETVIDPLDAVPRTGGLTDLVRRHFGQATVEAIVIVQCESGFDPNALNTNTDGSQDHGLFQINDVHERAFEAVTGHPWTARYDPELNTTFAAWLHGHAGGWGPWRCNRLLEQFDEPAP